MKIPVQQPQVSIQPVQPTQPIQAGFGMEQAAAQAQTGKVITEVAGVVEKARQRLEEMRFDEEKQKTLDAETQFVQNLNSVLYDKDKGHLNQTFENAKGASTLYQAETQEIVKKSMDLVKDLNPILQQKFKNNIQTHINTGFNTVVRHEAQQLQASREKSLSANLELSVASAGSVSSLKDLNALQDKDAGNITDYMQSIGATPEMIQAAKLDHNTRMLDSVIVPLIDTDWKKAETFLELSKDRISARAYSVYSKSIQTQKDRAFIDSTVSDLNKKYLFKDDITGALAEIKKMNVQPDVMDKLESQTKAQWDQNRAIKNEQDDRLGNTILSQITEGMKQKKSVSYLYSLIDKLPKIRMARDIVGLRNMVEQYAKPESEKEVKITNEQYSKIMNVMNSGQVATVQQFDRQYQWLPRSMYQGLRDSYYDRDGKFKSPEQRGLSNLEPFNLSSQTTLFEIGGIKKKDPVEKRMMFWNYLSNESHAFFEKNKRKPNDSDMIEIAKKASTLVHLDIVGKKTGDYATYQVFQPGELPPDAMYDPKTEQWYSRDPQTKKIRAILPYGAEQKKPFLGSGYEGYQ